MLSRRSARPSRRSARRSSPSPGASRDEVDPHGIDAPVHEVRVVAVPSTPAAACALVLAQSTDGHRAHPGPAGAGPAPRRRRRRRARRSRRAGRRLGRAAAGRAADRRRPRTSPDRDPRAARHRLRATAGRARPARHDASTRCSPRWRESRDQQRRLVADAGHELRTPLTSLRTNLDLLAQTDAAGGSRRADARPRRPGRAARRRPGPGRGARRPGRRRRRAGPRGRPGRPPPSRSTWPRSSTARSSGSGGGRRGDASPSGCRARGPWSATPPCSSGR